MPLRMKPDTNHTHDWTYLTPYLRNCRYCGLSQFLMGEEWHELPVGGFNWEKKP